MLVFLDTEFSDFAKPDLISLALVAEDGREFYAERTDYRKKGRVPGAACDSAELALRLRTWFHALPEPSIIIFDYQTDWDLLAGAMPGRPLDSFATPLHLDGYAITHPFFEKAKNLVYTDAWPPHHALADARALMAGYRAWRAFREKFGGIR